MRDEFVSIAGGGNITLGRFGSELTSYSAGLIVQRQLLYSVKLSQQKDGKE